MRRLSAPGIAAAVLAAGLILSPPAGVAQEGGGQPLPQVQEGGATPPAQTQESGGTQPSQAQEGGTLPATQTQGAGDLPPPPAMETPMPREGVDGNAATSPPGNPGEAEGAGITGEEVQSDAPNQPTPQGTRAPREETSAQTGGELYPLLQRVRIAPPALDGTPQPRPNPLASEPETEMKPDPRGNPEHLFREDYVE